VLLFRDKNYVFVFANPKTSCTLLCVPSQTLAQIERIWIPDHVPSVLQRLLCSTQQLAGTLATVPVYRPIHEDSGYPSHVVSEQQGMSSCLY